MKNWVDGSITNESLPLLSSLSGRQIQCSIPGTFVNSEQRDFTGVTLTLLLLSSVCVRVWKANTLVNVTCGVSAGSKNEVNCNCCAVQVLIQGVTQDTHVFLQVVPEKAGHIIASGVDHVTNTLQQIRDCDLKSSVQHV